jgi:regulator of replication initiation timing
MVFTGVVGALIGMIVELIVDNKIITELQEKNRKLKLENEQLRRAAKHEVIEIIDNRTTDEVKFGGF